MVIEATINNYHCQFTSINHAPWITNVALPVPRPLKQQSLPDSFGELVLCASLGTGKCSTCLFVQHVSSLHASGGPCTASSGFAPPSWRRMTPARERTPEPDGRNQLHQQNQSPTASYQQFSCNLKRLSDLKMPICQDDL